MQDRLFKCLIIILLNVTIVKSQSFSRITNELGDSNLSVRQIIQDKQGFLWFATFSGVYLYKGHDHVIAFDKNDLIDLDVTSIAEDNSGNIWIGTNNGLAKYNPQNEVLVKYYHDDSDSLSLTDHRIRCVEVDQRGRVWIGTRKGGLHLYTPHNNAFKSIKIGDNKAQHIKCILTDSDENIWFGTWGDGVYCLSQFDSKAESVTNYRLESEKNSLSHNNVYCLYENNNGHIAVGTRNGLNVIDNSTQQVKQYFASTKVSQGEFRNYIRSINKDKNGKLWIGTWAGLILCDQFLDFDTDKIELIYQDNKYTLSISNNQIMDILHDNSGKIWIGTESGLNSYDPYQNQFKCISGGVVSHLQEQTATSFCSYNDGLLIMTLSHGIIFRNKDNSEYFPANNHFASYGEKLYAMLVDSKNNVWAATYRGLLIRMDGKDHSFTSFRHSINDFPIYALEEGDDGTIFIGTKGEGLKYWDPKDSRFYQMDGIPNNIDVNDIVIDSKDQMWVASQYGIYRKHKNEDVFEHYLPETEEAYSDHNVFTSIEETYDGKIFTGGRNGFYYFDNSIKRLLSIDLGLQDALWITDIQVDSKNNIWLNLNFNQMVKVNHELTQISLFNVNNGIRSSQYNRRGFFMDHNDNLYLSGLDHIYQYTTSTPVVNTYSPSPVFTSLTVNNTEVHVGKEINHQVILQQSIDHQSSILLNHLNKDFTIRFISSSYLNKDKNKYKYMLHGYDEEWCIGTQYLAHYSNLPAGNYTFEVYGANNDGVWSQESSLLTIRINRAPLLSIGAMVIYIVVFVLLFLQIRRVAIIRLRLKKELFVERVKRENDEKLHKERLKFYTNISHELRTPLTLIMGPIQQLIDLNKGNTERREFQQLILDNTNRLLNLVNKILDFRKSVYEGTKLKVTYSNITVATKMNLESFKYMSKEKLIDTQFICEDEDVEGWFDQEKLDIILFNLFSNAYKYTPEMGRVIVELVTLENTSSAKQVVIKVTNTGGGIKKHLYEKIFDRFYQTDNNDSVTSTGIGLSLVKNLIELHHGTIDITSTLGESTTFIACLPIGKIAYTETEIFDIENNSTAQMQQFISKVDVPQKDSNAIVKADDKPRVVVVEDNVELREYIYLFLIDEYNVITANDGVEGLKACEEHAPHLIISDIMMDNMDGLEFCKRIKSTPNLSHVPVILMTALASSENMMEGYKTGADDYITKPFDPKLLKIRIKNLLNKLQHLKQSYPHDFNITPNELTISKLDEDLLNRVIELVEKNLDNSSYNNDLLCQDLGVSYSYLYRKIKNVAGVSPRSFVQTLRLKKAAQMLVETEYNISEVAFNVGYNDALYFSKSFKKHFGTSPSAYINDMKSHN